MVTEHSYHQSNLENESFDIIVIGSGMGGLSSAAILAKLGGKKVLVLEQHYTLGGFTHTFKRGPYEWDVGLHYVGQVHIPGSSIGKLFSYITDGHLQWSKMPEVYDKAVFGDKVYDFPVGREAFEKQMKGYFPSPSDVKSIDRYLQLLKEVANLNPGYFIDKALPNLVSRYLGSFLRNNALKYSDQTTLTVLQSLTDNKELIGVLTAQYGDYGLPPSKSSFYMHALLANHYMDGGAYPIGGAGQIAKTIVPVIESNGGRVLSNATVEEMVIKDGKAIGVKMKDGREIMANAVISDAGISDTFQHLVPKVAAKEYRLMENLLGLEPATAHVALYVGFKDSVQNLKLPRNNYWVFPPNYDHDEGLSKYDNPEMSIPVAFISSGAAKDSDHEKNHPALATLEVIALVPYDWFKKWEEIRFSKRDAEYREMKESFAQKLLECLFRVEPGLRGKIDYYELSTPLATRFFSHHTKGEIYGLGHTPSRFRNRALRVETPIKKLYLTGQDVSTAGIAGALMGGVLTASAILKKNVFGQVIR